MSLANLKGQRTRLSKRIDDQIAASQQLLKLSVPDDGLDGIRETIEVHIDLLDKFCPRYETLSSKIAEAMANKDDDELEAEGEVAIELILDISTITSKLSGRLKTINEKIRSSQSSCSSPEEVDSKLQKLIDIEIAKSSHVVSPSANVPLPKISIQPFSGDVLYWSEFWDSFAASVDSNPGLQNVQKLAYLRANLTGDAKNVISGLGTTAENYKVALDLLRERFGDEQPAISAHYLKIMDLPSPSNQTEKLRSMWDSLEQHLRCLTSLGEDVSHRHFISLIMHKLPKPVIIKFEEMKESKTPWSVDMLQEKLHCHLTARESADRQSSECHMKSSNVVRSSPGSYVHHNREPSDYQKNRYMESNRRSQNVWNRHVPSSTADALMIGDRSLKSSNMRRCVYCEGLHWSDECRKFPMIYARRKQLRGRCFNCLGTNHSLKECRSEKYCVYCGKKRSHHRSLCIDKFPVAKETATMVSEEDNYRSEEHRQNSSKEEGLLASGEYAILQTALVKSTIQGSKKTVMLRLLFDSGSHRTYVSQEAVTKMKLKPKGKEFITVSTFGAKKPKTVETQVVNLFVETQNGSSLELVGNVVPRIAGNIERKALKLDKYRQQLEGLKLADTVPRSTEEVPIDVLIGSDYYMELLTFEKKEVGDGLYLLGSKFGWILTGRVSKVSKTTKDVSLLILHPVNQTINQLNCFCHPDASLSLACNTEDLWTLETIGINEPSNESDDDAALKKFEESVEFRSGRYFVSWPWREELPNLPSNYELAIGRLRSLLRRMSSNSMLLRKYSEIIEDQRRKEIIEAVPDNCESAYLQHYIPHHPVVTPQKTTTKVRIVYDASAKVRKEAHSLNECLSRGPVMLEDLCGLLMRFRLNTVALVADIEKAFLQIGLHESDRDVTRFLWLKDHSKPTVSFNNVQAYRFCRVPFGVISSPFLLAATVRHHLKSEGSPTAKKISENVYVDNLVSGVSSSCEASRFYEEAKGLFNSASMNLREWNSNSKEFLLSVNVEDRTDEVVTKVLGIKWNTSEDVISIRHQKVVDMDQFKTKRQILKAIAGFFDPLGFFAPVLIRAKMKLQELWVQKFSWDDAVPQSFICSWGNLYEDMRRVIDIEIPRFIGPQNDHKESEYFLLCFCDASAKAYAAVEYLGVGVNGVTMKTNLIFAKSRLCPMKQQSIPRLELLAVLIGTRILKFTEKHLRLPNVKKFLWSDSQCVLQWIISSKENGVFVKNRLREIREHEDISFCYVETKQNPADLPSRGCTVEELTSNELWWEGPKLLKLPRNKWNEWKKRQENEKEESIVGSSVFFEASLMTNTGNDSSAAPFEIEIQKYSSFLRLLRITAWCNRFIKKIRKMGSVESTFVTSEEIAFAKLLWEKNIQSSHFEDVFKAVRLNARSQLQSQLDAFVDDDGLLRCNGRLQNAEAATSTKFPKLLPNKDQYTSLLIDHVHRKLLHAGNAQTLAKIREEYWIPQGRRKVRAVIQKCRVCRRWEGGPYKAPRMPSLPSCRVTRSKPFSFTGVDYFGRLFIKIHKPEDKKVWVCLFTCMTVRAIHLELVHDLTAEEFLLSLRRFISRRGTPSEIYCDNASTFKAASQTTDVIWSSVIQSSDVQSYFASSSIK